MATQDILIKRGLSANSGSLVLKPGELAVELDTGRVFIGTDSGKKLINPSLLDENGKLPESTLPALALTDVFEAGSESAMLGLDAQKGDVAIRSDISKSFILMQSPASVLENWIELRTPTDAVLSVNGETGAVTITDITGNAGTADRLKDSRTISISGDGVGSAVFDGSADAAIAFTLADSYYFLLKTDNNSEFRATKTKVPQPLLCQASSGKSIRGGSRAICESNGGFQGPCYSRRGP